MSIIKIQMTIISTAKPVTLEEGIKIAEERKTPAFPPVSDSIDFIKDVDWQDVRRRCRAGLNNVGLVIAVIGEKLHDAGCWLAEV